MSSGPGSRWLARALAVALLAVAAPLQAQIARAQKADLRLAADRTAYPPGSSARLIAIADVEPGWHLQAHVPTYDYLIPTVLEVEPPEGWSAGAVSYPDPVAYRFEFAEEELDVYEGRVPFLFTLEIPGDAAEGEATVRARLRYQACDDKQCLPPVERDAELAVAVGTLGEVANQDLFALAAGPGSGAEPGSPEPGASGPGGSAPAAGDSLLLVLALGIVGGLILNAMPCVLPILSLKVFGLVRSAAFGRREVVAGALATAAGILVSFWVLAGAAVAAKAAGTAVGWGIQFQRPGFVTFLAVVILLFTLNLWGLFEIPLPASLASRLGAGEGKEGFAGHFVTGLFATLMATPCSAPFLGTAVGFALAQEAMTVFAVFTAIAVGMALPYLLLAAAPGTARWLPKPGDWMETLRGVMGFLLAGALVWLLYVLGQQIPPEQLALVEVSMLAVGMGLWIASRFPLGSGRRRVWSALALIFGAATIVVAAESPAALPAAGTVDGDSGRIDWRVWDPAEAERLAASGTPVFLDITADWCVTCKVNERLVLETPAVRAALAEHGVVAMKADWTNRDDSIAEFLASHGRYGIPFYMVYRPGREPLVMSELLTTEQVLDAIEDAAGGGDPGG